MTQLAATWECGRAATTSLQPATTSSKKTRGTSRGTIFTCVLIVNRACVVKNFRVIPQLKAPVLLLCRVLSLSRHLLQVNKFANWNHHLTAFKNILWKTDTTQGNKSACYDLRILHMTVVLTIINFCVYSAYNFIEFECYAVQKILNAHSFNSTSYIIILDSL